MIRPRALLDAAVGYVRKNPQELVHVAKNAAGGRFGVPIAALRWFAGNIPAGKKTPKDIAIEATPPALRLGATIDAMGTPIRASAAIRIEDVKIGTDSIRIGLRLRDIKLDPVASADGTDSESPVAALLKSEALDLSKPGNILKFLPKKPAFILEADGDRIVIDLMKAPQLAKNEKFRRALSVLAPVFGIDTIETDADHLYVKLAATARGLPEAIDAFRK